MKRTRLNWFLAAACFALLTAGCSKPQDETARKLEEVQKQLDETKKQLDATKGQAEGAGQSAAGQTSPAASQPAPAQGKQPASSQVQPSSPAGSPAPPPAPKSYTLAAGTPVVVRTIGAVSTKSSSAGSPLEATLSEPLVADGHVIAAKGARVQGVVTDADPGGRVKGVATIAVALRSVTLADGRSLDIKTSSVARQARKSKTKDAVKVGIASGIGAAIGAIAGGGKGAAIGAGAGAAGGTGVVLATRGEPATIPAESALTFKLSAPVTVQAAK